MSIVQFDARSRAGQAVDRLHHRAAPTAVLEAEPRHHLQVPHVLSGHALAARASQAARIDVARTGRRGRRRPPAALVLTLRALRRHPVRASSRSIELRFFLNGESQLGHRLYEIAVRALHAASSCDRPGAARRSHSAAARSPRSGSAKTRACCPTRSRSFLGYRLLQEYFHFPEKFLFFDIDGLAALQDAAASTRGRASCCCLDRAPRLDQKLDAQNFRLAARRSSTCSSRPAEPIRLDHAHTEYRVVPDVRRQRTTEVYAVDAVTSLSPETAERRPLPAVLLVQALVRAQKQQTFWHATRRPSERKDDPGTEVFLTLVDLDFRPTRPPTDVITVARHVHQPRPARQCCPSAIPRATSISRARRPVRRISCLVKPTKTVRPPLRHGAQWRLISHLSLNFLSPVEGGDDNDPEVLQEILKLYDFSDSAAVQQQILGLVGVSSRQVWRRIRHGPRQRFRPRHRGDARVRREAVRRHRRLSVRVGPREVSRAVRVDQRVQRDGRDHEAARASLKRWPPRSGHQPLL